MSHNDLPVSIQPEVEDEEESLKYLDIVQKTAENAVPYVSKAYDYAKDNSGTLKPSMETTEGTLKTVFDPAVDTFHDVPVNVLKFFDRVVETASGLAKTAYTEIEPTAKEMLVKYEPVAEEHAASAWQSVNKVPLFHGVANAVIPTAGYVSEKYNQTVQQTSEEGYKASSYLPLVPTEKIAKVFKAPDQEEEEEEEEEEKERVVHSGAEGAVHGD
ncbi:stress-related protein isoform X2 [Lactuca sativa]|uniref:stress-related protein isoform X2 n=1 Tax=Lactuca sativa TaxID=4236 RepID=UPI000CD86482|nr:stress-related protein isoform X2 [Lactuca sativa]